MDRDANVGARNTKPDMGVALADSTSSTRPKATSPIPPSSAVPSLNEHRMDQSGLSLTPNELQVVTLHHRQPISEDVFVEDGVRYRRSSALEMTGVSYYTPGSGDRIEWTKPRVVISFAPLDETDRLAQSKPEDDQTL